MEAKTKREKGQTKYKIPPKFPPGTFDDLYYCMHYFTLEDVFDCLKQLGMTNQMVRDNNGNELSITDIICIEGSGVVATDSRRYYFYGGPEMIPSEGDTAAFKLIYGNVFQWLLDCILFRMTYDGWEVTQKLGLPL